MSQPVLQVLNVGKAYRQYYSETSRVLSWFGLQIKPASERWVLRGISFEVMPGEAVGIVGQNGAGKSTLLKLITGTQRPTEGKISINGRVAAILELGMGFNPEFTGRQNAAHSARLMGFNQVEIDQMMPEVEAFAEIGEYFEKPVNTYSSGMSTRLAFGVATAVRPEILIIDEALSVGDAYFQAKCFQRIATFKEKGTTLLLVSHSVEDIVKHCERAILLKNGGLQQDGSSRAVTNWYLDELFGQKKHLNSNIKTEKTLVDTEILAGKIDEFHTRPGYHQEEHRWGQGGAKILDYLIVSGGKKYPSRIEGNALTEFYFKAQFDSDVDEVVPGFLIKTLEGIFLYGTNSFIIARGQKKITATAGEIKLFKFSMPLNLSEGYYLVSFGISSGNPLQNTIPLDRRYDSVIILIERTTQFSGIFDLCASFEAVSLEDA